MNAMIVDSTALPEQVVDDVVSSAFMSAGQRCSALRLLFLQDDIADQVLEMIAGAMDELVIGDPADLETDVGPVITPAAFVPDPHNLRLRLSVNGVVVVTITGTPTDTHFLANAQFQSLAVQDAGVTTTLSGAVAISESDSSTQSDTTIAVGTGGLNATIVSSGSYPWKASLSVGASGVMPTAWNRPTAPEDAEAAPSAFNCSVRAPFLPSQRTRMSSSSGNVPASRTCASALAVSVSSSPTAAPP